MPNSPKNHRFSSKETPLARYVRVFATFSRISAFFRFLPKNRKNRRKSKISAKYSKTTPGNACFMHTLRNFQESLDFMRRDNYFARFCDSDLHFPSLKSPIFQQNRKHAEKCEKSRIFAKNAKIREQMRKMPKTRQTRTQITT